MSELDPGRIALIVAKPGRRGAQTRESVGTGYFLTGNLVLTAGHVADEPDWNFRIRADIGGPEKDQWSDAEPVWKGDVGVDAMLLRTDRQVGNWEPPSFVTDKDSGTWKSFGYSKSAADDKNNNRKTLPLKGSFDITGGQGFPEFSLTTEKIASAGHEHSWKGISGAPVFSTGFGEDNGLVGIITDANEDLSNDLFALPAKRLFEDIDFRSEIYPSFLDQLPDCFCLVLSAEGSDSGLVGQVGFVLKRYREQFQGIHDVPISIRALEAVRSPEDWAATVKALARAKYLIADVTSFQPIVMLLLGIRSVLRRGVTISVSQGEPAALSSSLPFNVHETRVLSYADDDFAESLLHAMTEGSANLDMDSNYLDLPAYHAVRAPRPKSWAEGDDKNMLVLCPFTRDYSSFYRKDLRKLIQGQTYKAPLRMLDLRSPRLVGQALYEQMRWSSWCLVDLTEWRANVCFELGVRLACSERDPMCIIQRSYAEDNRSASDAKTGKLEQEELLRKLLDPVVYDPEDPRVGLEDALSSWPEPPLPGRPKPLSALPAAATFQVAQASFEWQRDPILIPPHAEQRRAAELISAADQEQDPRRLVLFADNEKFDAELQAARQEKWIASWLYLQHVSAADDGSLHVDDHEDDSELVTFANLVIRVLKSSTTPRHIKLREEIETFLEQRKSNQRARESDNVNG
jgi:hypothetical protein